MSEYSITKNKFFMNMYDRLRKILKNINIKSSDIQIKIDNSSIHVHANEFMSQEIVNKILTSKKLVKYEIKFENNTIIYISSKKNIMSHVIKICTVIKSLKMLFNRDYPEHSQKITYYDLDDKKKFPAKKNVALGKNECNSALTFVDHHKNGDIIIYRREEMIKVLIHEMIHSNLIDNKIKFSDKSGIFCVNYEILLNEAYTETLATIINIFYTIEYLLNAKRRSTRCLIGNVAGKSIEKHRGLSQFKCSPVYNASSKRELNEMFKKELEYSTYICSKILTYYNISSINDIIKKDGKCGKIFPQETNVFAYYLLKNILLHKHMEFGKFIKNPVKLTVLEDIIFDNLSLLDVNRKKISDKGRSLRMTVKYYD